MRFIQDLSPETCHLLHRLYKESQHHRVRQRAHCILLSFQGINTTALMAIFSVDRITLYNWFDAWEAYHFAGLYDKKRCGRPPKLTEEEQGKAQHYLEQYPRDIRKVVHLVEQETSGTHLRRDTAIPQWFQASKAAPASDGHAMHC